MKKVEEQLKSAMERQTPDSLDSILSRCNTERKGTTMEKKITKRNTSIIKKVTAIAAAVALVLTAGIIAYNANWFGGRTNDVEAVIAFDVNPSLEIEIDKNETVINVNCLNDDAKKVVGDMQLKETKLDVAVNAVIGSMLKNGYLSVDRNSILVSVKAEDSAKAAALQKDISADITKMLAKDNIEAAVITQQFDNSTENKAEENKISEAKASFIDKIIAAGLKDAKGNAYAYDRLAKMSVNELKLLLDSKSVQLENVDSNGDASVSKYITEQQAIDIAVKDAGVTGDYKSKIEMDYDDGMMLYEVDVWAAGYEYEYEINAETGAIVDFEKEAEKTPDKDPSGNTTNENYIGEDKAYEIALKHAGIDASTASALKCKLDKDDGIAHYDVEFKLGNVEYDYEINAIDGTVIKAEKEIDDDDDEKNDVVVTPGASITKEEAIAAAVKHAGVDPAALGTVKCELDRENGKVYYDVEFKLNGFEYDYKINSADGSVLKADVDIDDDGKENGEVVTPNDGITKEEALAIAYADAGVSEKDVYVIGAPLDKDDGVVHYDVEFRVGNTEYEYEIDAKTGAILDKSIDVDDDDKPVNSGTDVSESDVIGEEKAIAIALGNAGLNQNSVTELECEYDIERGVAVYDVSFKSAGIEYDYEINAATGDIIKAETEKDD